MIVLLLFILLLLLWSNYEGLDTQENTLLQEIKRKTPVSNLSSKKENIHILPDDNRHFPQDNDDDDLGSRGVQNSALLRLFKNR